MLALQKIYDQKLIAIIRGFEPNDALHIARALYEGGIQCVEVAMNSPKPLQTIVKVTEEFGDNMLVGAGTVLDPETARSAILANARFILSPTLNIETVKMTKRYGVISIPGAMTPSEILTAFECGADIVKVFPANSFGPGYIKDLLGPLSQLKLLPTGGVDLNNVSEYLDKGAVGVALGSSLVAATESVTDNYLQELTNKSKQFVEQIKY